MATFVTKPSIDNKPPIPKLDVDSVKFGVVGYGYWGPNVVRNLDRLDQTELVAVCDKSVAARRKAAKAELRW